MIKLTKLIKTFDSCPAQWSGKTINNNEFYARYRWGWFTVEINDYTIFDKQIGEDFDGEMDTEEMLKYVNAVLMEGK